MNVLRVDWQRSLQLGGFLLQVLASILYCIGGLLIMREPVACSLVITLVLAIVMTRAPVAFLRGKRLAVFIGMNATPSRSEPRTPGRSR